jgi:hypothetical protein
MRNKIKLLIGALVTGLLAPVVALAVNFSNPADGFFVDLTTKGFPNTFAGLLRFFINIGIGIVGLISILFIIYGGFQYITSRGDEEQAAAGKKALTNAIIGLIIVILSYVVVVIIFNALVTGGSGV